MRYTQENFQEWIFFISDKMEYFTGTYAKEHGLVLDYSKKSLDDLERWILDNFNDHNDLIAQKELLDHLTIYIGQTFKKYIGGKWFIDLENKKNVTYSSFCRMESSLTTDIHWCSQQFKRFRDISTFEIVQ